MVRDTMGTEKKLMSDGLMLLCGGICRTRQYMQQICSATLGIFGMYKQILRTNYDWHLLELIFGSSVPQNQYFLDRFIIGCAIQDV
jgi:hypothetical protein